MALYQDGILISGANTLPKMTLADYKAMPADQRPTYWERLDADYDDVLAPKTDIATVESGTTASRAYSVGELVYVSGTLYRVKTAIASGATFTVGTNIEAKKVSDVVKPVPISTGTVQTLNSNVTIAAQYCKKVGQIVNVSILFRSSSVITSGNVFQLPWSPDARINPVAVGPDSTEAGVTSAVVLYSSVNKLIFNAGKIETTVNYALNFSYFTNN